MGKLVYIANPLGFSEAGRLYLKEKIIPKLLAAGCGVINPFESVMAMDTRTLKNSSKRMSLDDALALGEHNIADIRRATNILAILDGTDVDSGTAGEIGYACALGKKITGYRADFRSTGDSGSCMVNLQIQTFINRSGCNIYDNLDDAIKEITA